ncbi:hypothetical protein THAOC_05644, partial [Thalassiosira oceanica]
GVVVAVVDAGQVEDYGAGAVRLEGARERHAPGRVAVHDVHELALLDARHHARAAPGVDGQVLPGRVPAAPHLAEGRAVEYLRRDVDVRAPRRRVGRVVVLEVEDGEVPRVGPHDEDVPLRARDAEGVQAAQRRAGLDPRYQAERRGRLLLLLLAVLLLPSRLRHDDPVQVDRAAGPQAGDLLERVAGRRELPEGRRDDRARVPEADVEELHGRGRGHRDCAAGRHGVAFAGLRLAASAVAQYGSEMPRPPVKMSILYVLSGRRPRDCRLPAMDNWITPRMYRSPACVLPCRKRGGSGPFATWPSRDTESNRVERSAGSSSSAAAVFALALSCCIYNTVITVMR